MRSGNWLLAIAIVMVAACGGRTGGKNDGDAPTGGDSVTTFCSENNQCDSGVCEGGQCVAAPSCAAHSECNSEQYCHFPTLYPAWVDGTTGSCAGACTDDNSCGTVGQQCHAYPDGGIRRCWTNTECTPGVRTDCPPGEVCSPSSHTCKWPKDYCYFAEECPVGWECIDGTCIDPGAAGDCIGDEDCNDRPGCATGCTCNDGTCQVSGSCQPTPAGDIGCGEDNYCAATTCQPAKPCPPNSDDLNGHNQCAPYTLVCRKDQGDNEYHCGNPQACPDGDCPGGFVCNQNFNPPLCMSEDGPECTRDGQCPVGEYCHLPTSKCEPGCRDSADCAGSCPGQSWCSCTDANLCNCNNSHVCVSEIVTDTNQPCDTTDECAGGTVCAYNNPLNSIGCDTLGMGDCTRSCYQVCDLILSSLGLGGCPDGYKCGSGDGILEKAIMALAQVLLGGDTNASLCYPE